MPVAVRTSVRERGLVGVAVVEPAGDQPGDLHVPLVEADRYQVGPAEQDVGGLVDG